MELKNRIGIVSGSGRGIGRGIALGSAKIAKEWSKQQL